MVSVELLLVGGTVLGVHVVVLHFLSVGHCAPDLCCLLSDFSECHVLAFPLL